MSESNIKNPVLHLGKSMWLELDPTFQYVARENNLMTHELRAELWAGFMAAAFGSMIRDLGPADAKLIVVDALAPMAEEIAAEHNAKRH